MKKNTYLIPIFLLFCNINIAQINQNIDFRFGIGCSKNFNFDGISLNLQNELNYKISKYFSSSYFLDLGSNFAKFDKILYFSNNINIFLHPFKDKNNFNFRVGSGISKQFIIEKILNYTSVNGNKTEFIETTYYSPIGFNLIFENTFEIDQLRFSPKLFGQFYNENNINIGLIFSTILKFK